jgi:hypothetical protein
LFLFCCSGITFAEISHLKQAGAILLLVIVMAQTFSKCWLVVSFVINQRTIAATLCENRAKPNSDCHGKCYLRKQMTAQDKQESTPMNGGKEKFEVFLFNEVSKETPVEPYTEVSTRFPAYTAHTIQQDAAAIFHPPRA